MFSEHVKLCKAIVQYISELTFNEKLAFWVNISNISVGLTPSFGGNLVYFKIKVRFLVQFYKFYVSISGMAAFKTPLVD